MTEQQRDELLLAINAKLVEHDSKFDSMQRDIKSMQEQMNSVQRHVNSMQRQVNSMQEQMNSMQGQMNSMQGQMNSMQGQMNSMQGQIKSINKEIEKISGSIAVIEHEHGGNIQLLLDGQVGILEKLDLFEEKFKSNETALNNHSDRIWNLESKIGII